MNFQISKEQAEALVNYLATRPWIEVRELIPMLMTLPPLPEKESADVLAEK